MKKIIFIVCCILCFVSCRVTKKEDINAEYRKYKITKGLDPDVPRPFSYFEEFLAYKDSLKKQKRLHHPYLKANQVYLNKDKNDNYYVFQVFDDNGRVYIGSSNIVGDELSFPKEGVITVTDPIVLDLLGFYKLDETNNLTIERWKTSAYREWVENDIGVVKNDSIYLTGWHYAKPYKHKKKFLAKTHKTDFRMRYAPNLKAIRKPGLRNTTIFLIEEGTFKTDY